MTPPQWAYVSPWLKWPAMLLLGASATVGIGAATYYMLHPEASDTELVRVGIALIQASVSTALIVAIALFSRRTPPVADLRSQTHDFLQTAMPEAIADMLLPDPNARRFLVTPIDVEVTEHCPSAATYTVTAAGAYETVRFSTHLYLNTTRAALFFYLPLTGRFARDMDVLRDDEAERDALVAEIETVFDYEKQFACSRFGFTYASTVQVEEIGPDPCFIFCFTRTLQTEFIDHPAYQLGFANDVGQLIRSFMMTERRRHEVARTAELDVPAENETPAGSADTPA